MISNNGSMRWYRRRLHLQCLCGCFLAVFTVSASAMPVRRALILGNDSYPGQPLVNARNDASAVASSLNALGYTTTLVLDSNRSTMADAIEAFVESVTFGDAALLYYAGHGLQVDGENFLVPIDFRAYDKTDVSSQGYSLSAVLSKLIAHGAITQIVILDACRNNPFLAERGVHGGWAKTATSAGSFLAFGTAPGSTASDDSRENHGLFTKYLLQYIADPDLDIEQLFQKVRRSVVQSSGQQQVPWTASSLVGQFHMVPASDLEAPVLSNQGLVMNENQTPVARSMKSRAVEAGTGQPWRISELVDEATADLRTLHFKEALAVLGSVLAIDPRCAIALRLMGVVLHLMGRDDEAGRSLGAAIAIDPRDYKAYSYRCLIYAGRGVNEISQDCCAAIQLHETFAPAHLGAAIDLKAVGQLTRAQTEVNRAIELDPGLSSGFALRGDIEALQGQTRAAQDDYARATSLAINNVRF